jgi:hypothetical protein
MAWFLHSNCMATQFQLLASRYGKLTPAEFGQAAQWTLFANSTFSEAFFVRG